MTAHIKPEQFLLVGKFFMIAPRCNNAFSCGRGMCFLIEQRNLPDSSIALSCGRARKRFVDTGKKFRAVAANKIKCARLDQTLQHFPFGDKRSDPYTKIFERSVITCPLPLLVR